MNGISSISAWNGVPNAAQTPKAQGSYQANAATYGPAVASVMGLASAAGDSVGTVCSFSAESLERLGEAAKSGFSAATGAVGDAVTDAGTAIGGVVDSVEQGWSDFSHGVSTLVDEGLAAVEGAGSSLASKAESMVDSVESAVDSAASSVGDAFTSVADSIGSAASNAAAYLTLGAATGRQLLSEIA
ncbi:MAG: hypothetical protein JWP29_3088 [Rhodoferax sp.]|nr:hypothetical protein [Rhodoferax sp.]